MPPRPDAPTVERTLERLYKSGWPKPSEYSDNVEVATNYYEALKIIAGEAIMDSRDFALEKMGPKIGAHTCCGVSSTAHRGQFE
jgi:hypothetical protein